MQSGTAYLATGQPRPLVPARGVLTRSRGTGYVPIYQLLRTRLYYQLIIGYSL